MKPYRVPQLAKKYVEYDMILQHTDMPSFPDSRARLLFTFLNRNGDQKNGQEELYPLATSLVQMGLDTHDMIDIAKEIPSPSKMRSRQLKVLAGDYFSGRFYQLLAQAGSIDAVALLSQAICDVNESKMSMYRSMCQFLMPPQEYLDGMAVMRKKLFLCFTPWIRESDRKLWESLLQEFSLCDTLADELSRLEAAERFRFSFAFWRLLENVTAEEREQLLGGTVDGKSWIQLMMKYKVGDMLLDKLDAVIGRIRGILSESDDRDREDFGRMTEPFLRIISTPRTAVREG
ncbi:heptaprenyl diphosphate synthase component 1 [Paenibacillus sp. P96]|uniref:Heptaprenyl diphosphate synthase component 1 n=1 Tax=Paenibacillus zeirhizosphaerae TaxID=2987519 RepID=A0ABT9FPJ1_9BACL|nr:heptaprenyl diphosphate synthase component 1 [Paenibacillus sp. P96]MDP4096653.1 heptaprenyl diphosphate synthase component 1 [Paenibacillus sp. P96]